MSCRQVRSTVTMSATLLAIVVIAGVGSVDAFAQSPASALDSGNGTATAARTYLPLLVAQSVWLVLVGVGAPLASRLSAKTRESELRALNLPRGSIRAVLALLVVGTFMNFLVFGGPAFGGEVFDKILAALVGLTGSVIGFYFGGRSAAPAPPAPAPTTGPQEQPGGNP